MPRVPGSWSIRTFLGVSALSVAVVLGSVSVVGAQAPAGPPPFDPQQQPAPAQPPPPGVPVQPLDATAVPGPTEPPPGAAVPGAPTTAPALNLAQPASAPPEPSPAFYERWWFWTAVGAVALTTLIIVATSSGSRPPSTDLGNKVAF